MKIEKYLPLARATARDMSGNQQEYDDYLGAAYEGLVVAFKNLDPNWSKGESQAYLKRYISGFILNHIRSAQSPVTFSDEEPYEEVLKKSDDRELIKFMLGLLSERQADIFLRYNSLGETQQEIAKTLGVSQVTISKVLAECDVVFRQHLQKTMGKPEK